jgi:hypothetical protein
MPIGKGQQSGAGALGGALKRRLAERQQFLVDLVFVRRAQAVGGALVDFQGGAPDELGLERAGVGERHDLIVVALDDERWHIELLQVVRLVGLRECLDAGLGAAGLGRTSSQRGLLIGMGSDRLIQQVMKAGQT